MMEREKAGYRVNADRRLDWGNGSAGWGGVDGRGDDDAGRLDLPFRQLQTSHRLSHLRMERFRDSTIRTKKAVATIVGKEGGKKDGDDDQWVVRSFGFGG